MSRSKFKIYYTVERADKTGRIDKEFSTYEDAYDCMCKAYVRALNEGYKPMLYRILKHTVTNYSNVEYDMVQFV